MNEDKKELADNELEKVSGDKLRSTCPDKDLSDEDREKQKALVNDRSGYIYRRRNRVDPD